MNLQKDKYIIVEVIPTRSSSKDGIIAQISALKLNGIKLEDRFDYRVEDKLIDNEDILRMVQYDKNMFTYVDNKYFIIEKFKHWAKNYPLLIIEEAYTLDYLRELKNQKELIFKYLGVENEPHVFEKLISKYNLQPSNHLVDLLYESIIYEGNNKNKE